MAIKNNRRPAERGPWLLAVLALCVTTADFARAECQGMVLHAHRGSAAAPENSLTSIKLAFEGDWDGVEIDIQQLRDRQWVLHHDAVLGRTTSLQGRAVRDLDSTAWREVRLKDRKGRVGIEPAAFLVDVLQSVPGRDDKVLNVEIKQFNGSCDAAQQAVALLNRARPDGRWFLTSIDRRQLQCARRTDPRGYLGQIVLDARALARESGARNFASNLPPPVIDSAWLRRLQQEVGGPLGVHVDINTLTANPTLLAEAKASSMSVFSYHLGPDREHVASLKAYARKSGLLPSGAIIDGKPDEFCNLLDKP
jgi:glycerophosphoryl diester phosphodiesterase